MQRSQTLPLAPCSLFPKTTRVNSAFDAPEIDWAAIENRWQIEPELRRTPPRRVVARGEKLGCRGMMGQSCLGCGVFGVFILGLMLSLWAGLALLILPFGSTTKGTITQHEITSGHSPRYGSSGENYFLHFQFSPPGQSTIYSGEWPVGGDTFLDLPDGAETQVRYFAFAPGVRPMLEAGVSPWFHVLFLGPLGLLMLVCGGLPLLAILPQARPGKRLVKRGVAAPGIVTQIDGHYAHFLFRVSNAHDETRVIEATNFAGDNVGRVMEGEVVTILFEPRRPVRARIYQLCEWRARNR